MNRNVSIKIGTTTVLVTIALMALLWALPVEVQGARELSITGDQYPQPGPPGLKRDSDGNAFPSGTPVGTDQATDNRIIARTDAVLMRLSASDVSISVLDNDVYLIGDRTALSVSAVTNPTNGQAEILANGTVTYTPNAGFIGRDGFHYTMTDGTSSSEGRVWVTVPDPNAPRWEVLWPITMAEGETADLRVMQTNSNVTVDDQHLIGVTLHVGILESTGDTDDIIVTEPTGDILPDHPFTRNIHHDGARVYIAGPTVGDAEVSAMTIEAIDDGDGDETLAFWSYVNGYLAGSGTITISAP